MPDAVPSSEGDPSTKKTRTIQSVAPWYGSQAGVNHLIIPQLGEHDRFFDLCGGGCSMVLAKPENKGTWEIVNDQHPGLINFLVVLASPRWNMLNGLISHVAVSEAIFNEAAAFFKENGSLLAPSVFNVDVDHVKAAYYQYILWWMGQGGMAGTQAAEDRPRFSIRYTDGGRVASRFRNASRSIPHMRKRFERVEFWCQDLFKVVDKIEDRPGTVIYCDPPWLDAGGAYTHNFDQKRGDDDGEQSNLLGDQDVQQDDFDRLEAALGRFKKARVLIRIGDHDRLASLFTTGWSRMRIERTNQISSQSARDATAGNKSQELLICNQDFIPTTTPETRNA